MDTSVKQVQKPIFPNITAESTPEGELKFTYNGDFPIGVGFTVKRDGHTYYCDYDMEDGHTKHWSAQYGVTSVTCVGATANLSPFCRRRKNILHTLLPRVEFRRKKE